MNVFFKKNPNGLKNEDFLYADPAIDLSKVGDDICINAVASLDDAQVGDLSFFVVSLVSDDKYKSSLEKTKASYCILKKQYEPFLNSNTKAIFSDEPYITFMRLCKKLFIEKDTDEENNISESAKISQKSSIGNGVKIGNNVVINDFVRIGNGVKIGDNTIIMSGAKIGNNCSIGENCVLYENCCIKYSQIGDKCHIHEGATVGQDGFGYIQDIRTGYNEKIDHFGYVKIGNRVSIGSNSCVDRSVLTVTIIEDDVKIDNLVQIAHNVKIGKGTMIAGQSGIAGSATIGKYCMLGGKSGVAGHITLEDQCILHGATNVSKSFPKHSKIIGTPGELYHIWVRNYGMLQFFFKKQLSFDKSKSKIMLFFNNLLKKIFYKKN